MLRVKQKTDDSMMWTRQMDPQRQHQSKSSPKNCVIWSQRIIDHATERWSKQRWRCYSTKDPNASKLSFVSSHPFSGNSDQFLGQEHLPARDSSVWDSHITLICQFAQNDVSTGPSRIYRTPEYFNDASPVTAGYIPNFGDRFPYYHPMGRFQIMWMLLTGCSLFASLPLWSIAHGRPLTEAQRSGDHLSLIANIMAVIYISNGKNNPNVVWFEFICFRCVMHLTIQFIWGNASNFHNLDHHCNEMRFHCPNSFTFWTKLAVWINKDHTYGLQYLEVRLYVYDLRDHIYFH